jgi:hypothetical protein
MPVVTNALYSNPQVGGIVSNLATAIYGDPETRMKRDYYNAEGQAARSRAGLADAQAAGVTSQNQAFAGFDPSTLVAQPGETPQQHFQRISPTLGNIVRAGRGNSKEIADGITSLIGNVFAQGGVNDQGTSLVMGGHMPGKDFAPTAERADAVAGRDADALYKKDTRVADIKAKSDTDVAGINQGGALKRLYAAPIVMKPGEDAYIGKDDPRYASMGTNGVIHGAPTVDTVRAAAGNDILGLPSDQAPSPNIANTFSGGAGYKGATTKDKNVSGKNLDDAITAAAAMVPGASTLQSNGKTMRDTEFETSLDPGKVQAGRTAAAAELARSGDVQKAGQAYLAAAGIQSGSTYSAPHGPMASVFLGHGGVAAPAAPPAPGTPASPMAPAAPAAPVTSAAQIPPAAQRPIGMKIQSAHGELEWSGTGWRPTVAGRTY